MMLYQLIKNTTSQFLSKTLILSNFKKRYQETIIRSSEIPQSNKTFSKQDQENLQKTQKIKKNECKVVKIKEKKVKENSLEKRKIKTVNRIYKKKVRKLEQVKQKQNKILINLIKPQKKQKSFIQNQNKKLKTNQQKKSFHHSNKIFLFSLQKDLLKIKKQIKQNLILKIFKFQKTSKLFYI
ncbi:hypothetical protein TTHERM_000136239 (macronuclear) [Tetrahymena thermophila SB210]|uniref:Uncharacterized protein n=1 Tax=Tetrahymena thermophila (strain SB210) TaxID=312017 RepID=W7XIP2_TETTS|nr:hypothetical protein TTHERM_000136239 [Tetrahymena thermophila SB210]EWS73489.1 hypothetical protein TTHERM_000136239 [Tetrahymena thermophila SB210]|eukprot:XP_012653971.1 hypothetical protein TTHERM_000136239 [Tetrahymena thermophila SB210]